MRAVAALILFGAASSVSAHPLGNFTVNRYARLEPDAGSLAITYIVDYAEIPTFQELARFPSLDGKLTPEALAAAPDVQKLESHLANAWLGGLRVSVDDRPTALAIDSSEVEFFPGVGGLPTMKLRMRLGGNWPASGEADVRYEDTNDPQRLGWREVVLRAGAGLESVESTTALVERSQELTKYPSEPNADFPQQTTAQLRIRGLRAELPRGRKSSGTEMLGASLQNISVAGATTSSVFSNTGDRFAALMTQERWTPTLILASLIIAFALGGLHALSPGHGKTIVAAYLVGSRGTMRHAVLLGAIVTAAHTAGVFLLGFVTLALSAQIVPETLYPLLQLVSGVAIVGIGAATLIGRIRKPRDLHGEHEHEDGVVHHHAHHRHHHHGHSHEIPADAPTFAKLLALGVSGGVLPCPSALVVLLSAVALHRIGVGLVLIVAFSLGLASVLSGVGILVVRAGNMLARFDAANVIAHKLPEVSALFVTILGLGIAAAAFPEAHRVLF